MKFLRNARMRFLVMIAVTFIFSVATQAESRYQVVPLHPG
jgi:hypothetical protein